jgi:hypothetical protein
MLDRPEKTYQLLAALKAAVPFEVELTPSLIAHLQAQQVAVAVKPRESSRKSHMRARTRHRRPNAENQDFRAQSVVA